MKAYKKQLKLNILQAETMACALLNYTRILRLEKPGTKEERAENREEIKRIKLILRKLGWDV